MLELKIGSKTYKVEYSVEAALYGNCTEKVAEFFTNGATAQGKDAIKSFISTICRPSEVSTGNVLCRTYGTSRRKRRQNRVKR